MTSDNTQIGLYAQDDWQARSNLTFNVGLRYEFNQHMYDVNNRLSSIDLSVPGGRFVNWRKRSRSGCTANGGRCLSLLSCAGELRFG